MILDRDTKSELSAIEAVCRSDTPNPHIIQVYEYWYQDHGKKRPPVTATYIRMQLCNGTLEEYLKNLEIIKPLELIEIMIHILTGLYHCHVQGYCHRDLKLPNGASRRSLITHS